MKNLVFILAFLIPSCTGKQESAIFAIDYLGQNEPKETPQIFAPDIILLPGRFEMGFTISPNGESMAFGVAHETNPEETCIFLLNFLNGKWSSPDKNILPDNVNTFFPMFGPDEAEFYFVKSTNDSATDLWVAKYIGNEVGGRCLIENITFMKLWSWRTMTRHLLPACC